MLVICKRNSCLYWNNSKIRKISFISLAAIIILFIAFSFFQKDVSNEQTTHQANSSIQNQQTISNRQSDATYKFRDEEYLTEHFKKHGDEFNYASAQEYLEGANKVIASPDALHKIHSRNQNKLMSIIRFTIKVNRIIPKLYTLIRT